MENDTVDTLCARIRSLAARAAAAGQGNKIADVFQGIGEDLEAYEELFPELEKVEPPGTTTRVAEIVTRYSEISGLGYSTTIATPCLACGKFPSGRTALACLRCGEL